MYVCGYIHYMVCNHYCHRNKQTKTHLHTHTKHTYIYTHTRFVWEGFWLACVCFSLAGGGGGGGNDAVLLLLFFGHGWRRGMCVYIAHTLSTFPTTYAVQSVCVCWLWLCPQWTCVYGNKNVCVCVFLLGGRHMVVCVCVSVCVPFSLFFLIV